MSSKRSSIDLLRRLDPVFDLADVVRVLRDTAPPGAPIDARTELKTATQYCWRWSKLGYARMGGPRLGVYYNLIREPEYGRHLGDLVLKAISRPAVVAGASALNHHGWTTQMPHRLEIAVAVSGKLPTIRQIDDVTLAPRPRRWFERAFSRAEPGPQGLPTLPPEYALVDVVRLRADGVDDPLWLPDPDDISIDVDDEDRAGIVDRILAAADALGVDPGQVLGYVRRIDGFEDAAAEPSIAP